MAQTVQVPSRFRRFLYAVLVTSWCSGVVFFILNQWVRVDGEFGPEKHPWQFGVLRIHGAGAFLMMITFGYLLASHVKVGWPLKKFHPMGLVSVGSVAFLIVSAYGLYYIGDPGLRALVAYCHAAVGVCLPILVTAHLVRARRRRNSQNPLRAAKARAA